MDDFVAFARLLDALRPWLGHVVIIGGWAHRLHRFHPLSHPPQYAPLRTKDADVAFSTSAPLTGDIAAAMKTAGFHKDFSGEHTPPITQYRLGGDDQGFFAEFLTPLHGSGLKRNGQPDVSVAKAGVTAQKLRHLDLLLVEPWNVQLTKEIGVPVSSPVQVMLPNPVTFIAQKLLIQKHRKPDKKAQDALYIHDTLELFGGELTALKALWQEKVRPTLLDKTARTVDELQREQFGTVTDVIRNAARIPQDRVVTAERLQVACAYGLGEIFG
ncbi:MAG: GSU2403 family nucleotidyltransferase fold protein [Vicinamibacterales bacterium]